MTTREHGAPRVKRISLASREDRDVIYRLRHDVFARELGQHDTNDSGRLQDGLDACNEYIVIRRGEDLCGHISLTPPTCASYSVDKYLPRTALPFDLDSRTFEVRLLSVRQDHRGAGDALLLMYAAYRLVCERGGLQVFGMGRRAVLPFYEKNGLLSCGVRVRSGAVEYEIIRASVEDLGRAAERQRDVLVRLLSTVEWDMPGTSVGAFLPMASAGTK